MRLFDMRPVLASHKIANRREAYVILVGQLFIGDATRAISAAYLSCLGICEFMVRASLTSFEVLTTTPFSGHIRRIIGGCADKEVFWTDAIPYIAPMANEQAGKYGADAQFMGKAVGQVLSIAETEPAVSIGIEMPAPQPASLSLLNLAPEVIDIMPAMPAQVRNWLALDVAPFRAVARRYGRGITAATHTQAAGIRFWYTLHSASLHLRLVLIPRLSQAARGFSVSIIPQVSAL